MTQFLSISAPGNSGLVRLCGKGGGLLDHCCYQYVGGVACFMLES